MADRMTLEYWTSQLDEIWLGSMKSIHPGKDIDQAIKEAYGHLISDTDRLRASDGRDFKKLVNTWLSNTRTVGKKQQTKGADLTNL